VRRISRALAIALLCTACAGAPPIDETFIVGNGELDVSCDGGAGPTLMFVSAIGGDDSLRDIADRLAGEANACFYFRPGDGETAPPDGARSAFGDGSDLHELFRTAGLATPAIIVAHSYGGFITMALAADHPEDIAGVVFIDASTPAAEARSYLLMNDEQRAYYDSEMEPFVFVDWPRSVEEAGAALESFPTVPSTVITATQSFIDPCDPQLPCEALQETWIDVQTGLAEMIGAKQVLAATSHYVHVDNPDLVVNEIRDLVERSGVNAEPTPESG
jgi:pimeloyl-ACP methyl ester carboxylesterase